MPRVPQSHNNTTPVQKFDDTAYDAVVVCAENIDYIINAAGGMSGMVLYLGAFAVPPTEGHDGAPLVDGNFYLNTTTNRLNYYDATDALWVEVDNQTVIDAANAAEASRLAAEVAEQAAAVSEANAASSEAAALASEQAAATSEANALASETAAAQSEADALASENAAAASASNSLSYSQAAAQSEANAATSETNAANSASAALTSEGNASASESAAANSAVVAAGYAADAEAAFDNFNDLYLGAFAVDPTTDNDGQPLQVGASYWNTVTSDLRFWSGATWDVPEQTASQAAADALAYRDDAQVSETDAAASAEAASTSEANALASEQAAATSESNALASENAAALSESNAATSASQAATSASSSATSEANAAQSAADAQQSADDAAAIVPSLQSQIDNISDDVDTLEWKQFVRNEATLNQMREQNKSVRAASGFDHMGQHANESATVGVINEGLYSYVSTDEPRPNELRSGRTDASTNNKGTSETRFPVTCIAGFISKLKNVHSAHATALNYIKFPDAPDGTVTYNSATGEVIQHVDAATAFALADTSDDIEVVINRVDMFGAEFFLEEVSQANPYVYPKGMIQSQATSMNGIATTTSNRPVTYYAVYDGDTGSQGLGVDFWNATDEQKKALVSDETNNIFMLDDGRLVQWRMRQRTIAGAGNGDWDRDVQSINPVIKSRYGLTAGRGGSVPQGYNDTIPAYGTAYWTPPNGTTNWNVDNTNNGVYQASGGYGGAPFGGMFGLCFFHVWGVVPRLNQGAYHPSFNPMGAGRSKVGNRFWYATDAGLNSPLDCFPAGVSTGNITGNASGRDDGRFYDAIHASGQGGVNDYRLPSWDMSSKEEASKVFQKVVNGSYRGEEKVPFTEIASTQATITGTWGNDSNRVFTSSNYSGDTVRYAFKTIGVAVDGGVVEVRARGDSANIEFRNDGVILLNDILNTAEVAASLTGLGTGLLYAVTTNDTNSTVSGEFTMVDVIGNPAEILATPDLANGWQGGWIPSIPAVDNNEFYATRKALRTPVQRKYTNDNGLTWSSDTEPLFDSNWNGRRGNFATNQVTIWTYAAFAKQTVEANNAPVLNGSEGVGELWAYSGYGRDNDWGVLLQEALTGKVGVSGETDDLTYMHPLTRLSIHRASHIIDNSVGRKPKHSPIELATPTNDSPAVKALWYQTANNQQVSLNFAWNELVWDSTPANTLDGTTAQPVTSGNRYVVTTGNGWLMARARFTGTVTFNTYVRDNNGDYWFYNGKSLRFSEIPIGFTGDWGDDSTIRITNGTGMYTNLNGDTCLYGTSTLSKPIGYTKNQARIGEQVKGVDL